MTTPSAYIGTFDFHRYKEYDFANLAEISETLRK
jgi:hypothetical protein